MATAGVSGHWRKDSAELFYPAMAVFLTAIVLFGFSHTIPLDLSTPDFPLLLVAHGMVFFAWMALFIAQPILAMRGSLALHRRLGWAGAAIATAMVVLACAAILFALWSDSLPGFYPPGLFLLRGAMGVVTFAGLVIAAITCRRRSAWHKRLMLCATIVVIAPGLERALPVPIMGPAWFYTVDLVILAIAAVGPAFDLVTQKRIHPAYFCGVGAILAGQISVDLLLPSPLAPALVRFALGH
jgi:hypothetical protein